MAFLDDTGLAHFWSKIKNMMTGKADTDMGNVDASDFFAKALDSSAVGIPVIEATSEDGVAYTATLTGITDLTVGLAITIVPNRNSASTGPTLDLNGLGAKPIRQKMTYNTAIGVQAEIENWMVASRPLLLIYDGDRWGTVITRPNAADMYGTIKIENGGTGAGTAEDARKNLGIDVIHQKTYTAPTMSSGWTLSGGGWFKIGNVVYVNMAVVKSKTIATSVNSRDTLCSGLPSPIYPLNAPVYHVKAATTASLGAVRISGTGTLEIAVPSSTANNACWFNFTYLALEASSS